jgi:hypothetical protein
VSLHGSGLLTLRAGKAVFLHQTLLEYLAARHATRDEPARAHAYKALNRPARYWPWTATADIPQGIRRPRWGRRFWMPPSEHADSFVGFLLDIGYAEATEAPLILDPVLKRLVTHGGVEGCAFIARQTQLGTRLPDSITGTAAETLSELAPDGRRNPVGIRPSDEPPLAAAKLPGRAVTDTCWPVTGRGG